VNVFFAKFWIRVVRSMKNLPMSVREALAKVIARILWLAIPKRRHVIETNRFAFHL
jgi:KDO2-lipid IV(A) lauroyltransferase